MDLYASVDLPIGYLDIRQNDFDLIIGGQGTSDTTANRFWTGDLDEIRIWDVARSSIKLYKQDNTLSGHEEVFSYLNFEGFSPYTDKASSLEAATNGNVATASLVRRLIIILKTMVVRSSSETPSAGNDTLISIENIDYTGVYDSEITGDDNNNELRGGSGDDIIKGGKGDDVLYHGGGNDFLYGEEGNDYFHHDGSGYTVSNGGEMSILFFKMYHI